MATNRRCPDIFAYERVRPFLQDWRAMDKKRSFAALTGVSRLNTVVAQVFGMFSSDPRHMKPISPTYTEAFVRMLQLDEEEARYFRLLVRAEDAKAQEDRVWAAQEAGRIRRARLSTQVPTSHVRLLEWYYFAILTLAMSPGCRNDPVAIARRMRPELAPEDVARAINHLLDAGVVEEDADGCLRALEDVYRIDPNQEPEVYARRMADWYRWFVERGSGALSEFGQGERDYRATVVNVPAPVYRKVAELLKECHERIENLCKGASGEGERVYVVTSQLFPLTTPSTPAPEGRSTRR